MDINVDINMNAVNTIDTDLKSIDTSFFVCLLFDGKVFVAKFVEITYSCARAYFWHAQMILNQMFCISSHNSMKTLK